MAGEVTYRFLRSADEARLGGVMLGQPTGTSVVRRGFAGHTREARRQLGKLAGGRLVRLSLLFYLLLS